jgi:DNA-binding transcriptional MerR regulator
MFSIGEFAKVGTVSVRTLRLYDEMGLLHPARVDPETGYRYYAADQLRQLNRIIALKELGLTLAQARQLIAGITVEELRGMLALRRAQLEQAIEEQQNQLFGVESRLRYIESEGSMPADDITVKKIPAHGVVAIAEASPGWDNARIVSAVNRCEEQFRRLGVETLVKRAGPYLVFFEEPQDGDDVLVNLALPVAEQPAELPAPAKYVILPEIEAATAVRNGPAASIFPQVYQDLVRWIQAHGFEAHGPNRDIWINEVDDIADSAQQVFEIQLPFTRPE